jgi:hypothetical protein
VHITDAYMGECELLLEQVLKGRNMERERCTLSRVKAHDNADSDRASGYLEISAAFEPFVVGPAVLTSTNSADVSSLYGCPLDAKSPTSKVTLKIEFSLF